MLAEAHDFRGDVVAKRVELSLKRSVGSHHSHVAVKAFGCRGAFVVSRAGLDHFCIEHCRLDQVHHLELLLEKVRVIRRWLVSVEA